MLCVRSLGKMLLGEVHFGDHARTSGAGESRIESAGFGQLPVGRQYQTFLLSYLPGNDLIENALYWQVLCQQMNVIDE